MNDNCKLGSLFDGSGGFPLAGSLCGIEPVWAAEVEPYPIAVTRSRFPKMKHLGDISKINGAEIEPVDLITFGSPCQDLSVAGKRAGLKHEVNGDEETTRSGLFMEAVRIIKEMRDATNGEYPRFALWENVPGAFSSNKGEDFLLVCEELIKIVEPTATMPAVPKNGWSYADSYIGDGWSLAYRVFDAQYWGVPQRRRRIHLVADFRGECAREVLFEREGVRGYFTQGRTPWQAAATDAQNCPGADDREGESNGADRERQLDAVIAIDQQGGKGGANYAVNVMPTICSDSHGTPHAVAFSFDSLASNSMKSKNPHSGCREVGVAKTLDTTDPNPSKNQGGIAIVQKVMSNFAEAAQSFLDDLILDDQGGQQITVRTDGKAPTLRAETHGNLPCVMESIPYTLKIRSGCEGGGKGALIQEDKSATLATNNDQYLFQPLIYDARGNGDGKTASTLTGDHENRITDYSNVCVSVKCAGFKPNQGVKAQGLGYEEEVAPTLLAGQEPGVVYCLQGNGIDRADTAGCNGKGWNDESCYTLNTIDRPAVCYLSSGKNAVGTLMANASTKLWLGNQEAFSGDYHIIEEHPICVADHPTPKVDTKGTSFTLSARDYKAPLCVTLPRYIVRRLTPTECARLQGFADWWGHIEQKDSLTDEEYRFWLDVRNTHAAINGKKVQDYTKKQMLNWYNKLWTDSAEYKMWGNGIALPPALYCLQGIADALEKGANYDENHNKA